MKLLKLIFMSNVLIICSLDRGSPADLTTVEVRASAPADITAIILKKGSVDLGYHTRCHTRYAIIFILCIKAVRLVKFNFVLMR